MIDVTKQKRYFISNNREIRSETFFLELAKIKIWDWNGIFSNATVSLKKNIDTVHFVALHQPLMTILKRRQALMYKL